MPDLGGFVLMLPSAAVVVTIVVTIDVEMLFVDLWNKSEQITKTYSFQQLYRLFLAIAIVSN